MRLVSRLILNLCLLPVCLMADSAYEDTQGDVTRSAVGLTGGFIEDLEVASNGNLYAGLGAPSGVFCSTDNAANWMAPPAGSDFGSIADITVGENANTIYFIGGIDLYKSSDACTSFSALGSSDDTFDFGQSLAFGSDTLLVVRRDGTLDRSTDNGSSFSNVELGTDTSAVAVAASPSQNVFFALGSVGGANQNTIFQSTDAGVNWTSTGHSADVREIGVDPNNGDIIVASGFNTVDISADGGSNFSSNPPSGISGTDISFPSSGTICVGPQCTTNQGTNWTNINDSATSTDSELFGFIRQDPTNSNIFYARSLRGVSKSTDNQTNWSDSVAGMIGVTINDIAQNFDNKDVTYFAGLGGVAKTTNFTDSDNRTFTYPIDVTGNGDSADALFLFPTDVNSLLVAATGEIYKTTDGATTFSGTDAELIIGNGSLVGSFAQTDNSTIYAGYTSPDTGQGGVIQSTDSGSNWSDTSITNSPSVNVLLAVENMLFAGVGTEDNSESTARGIYKLANGSWSQLSDSNISGKKINDLVSNGSFIFAAAGDVSSGGVYRSSDNGDSWEDLSSNFEEARCMQSLAVDPENLSTIYVAFGCPAGTGVIYKSENSGTTWETHYTGLKDEVPNAMLVDDLTAVFNTGAFEFNEEGGEITVTMKLKKCNGSRCKAIATVKEDGSAKANQSVKFICKKRSRGKKVLATKTTSSNGKARKSVNQSLCKKVKAVAVGTGEKVSKRVPSS